MSVVMDRLRAAAASDSAALLGLGWDAARGGQWLEAAKGLMDAIVTVGHLDRSPLVPRGRDVLMQGWDLAKEALAVRVTSA